jgi:hypothetical protein
MQQHTRTGRRLVATIALATGLAGVLTTPASAGTAGTGTAGTGTAGTSGTAGPVRYEARSSTGTATTRTVKVGCAGATAYAAGARIIGGKGEVVLTAMSPDPGLAGVTVSAQARGQVGDWTLVGYAVCGGSAGPAQLVQGTAWAATGSTVTCPDDSQLMGAGFRIDSDSAYLHQLALDPGTATVGVHLGGGLARSLTATAVCKQPTGPLGVLIGPASTTDAGWPKTVALPDTDQGGQIYGVAAAVRGPVAASLTALVPDNANHRAVAEADLVLPAGIPGGMFGADEEPPLTVWANHVGTFH